MKRKSKKNKKVRMNAIQIAKTIYTVTEELVKTIILIMITLHHFL